MFMKTYVELNLAALVCQNYVFYSIFFYKNVFIVKWVGEDIHELKNCCKKPFFKYGEANGNHSKFFFPHKYL